MFFPENYEFICPVKTNAGKRALEHLPVELQVFNARRPLIITGKEMVYKRLAKKVFKAFNDSGIALGIFDGVDESADLAVVKEIVRIFRSGEHDSLLALGGDTVGDVSKLVNIALSYSVENLEKVAVDNGITQPLGPFVLLPTLAGNGYEVSKFAFLDGLTFSSPFLMPDLVIIDPRLLATDDVTTVIETALIALVHAVEAYVGPAKNPVVDTYAFAAIQFVMEHLVDVIKKPRTSDGRLALANAVSMAGCAFSNSRIGIVHLLGEKVSEMFDLPHGVSMAQLLPYCLESVIERDSYHIGDLLLPLAGFDEYAATADNLRAYRAVNILYDLQHTLTRVSKGDVPLTLEAAGVPKYMLTDIAEWADSEGIEGLAYNDCVTIVTHAWEGRAIMRA